MIVIAGRVAVRPERREEAVRAALAMAAATRKEDGCITYQFSNDLADMNSIVIFEEWESDEALAQHFQTEHMKVFRELLPRLLAGPSTVKRYVVQSVSPMT
jgi:quinol monooxygenase YgiN